MNALRIFDLLSGGLAQIQHGDGLMHVVAAGDTQFLDVDNEEIDSLVIAKRNDEKFSLTFWRDDSVPTKSDLVADFVSDTSPLFLVMESIGIHISTVQHEEIVIGTPRSF